MNAVRLSIVAAVLAAAIACGGYGSSSPATPSSTPSPSTDGSPSVTIPAGASFQTTSAFAPDDLTIAAGTTVTWINTDSVSHTSTSDGTGWNSATLEPGGRFAFTFQTAGTFPYHCVIHPGMVGTVVVH